MVNANSGTSRLDAVACLLIVKLTAEMNKNIRGVLWETMPYRFPDLTAHVPALITAVRDETQASVLGRLSYHPLPTTLSPETAGWRDCCLMFFVFCFLFYQGTLHQADLLNHYEGKIKNSEQKMDKECPLQRALGMIKRKYKAEI